MGKYKMKQAKTGPMFNLVAGNGEIVGTSQIYHSKAACLNGIESVRKNAPIAPVVDLTKDESGSNPKFEIFLDKAGEFRFHLMAANGEIVLASEGYVAKSGCKNGIDSVTRNSDSEIIDEV
ncbi:MAG: YegP family protein [Coriobacteriia bacterium]|nr:YegP family protein [Coriobacteriia bacterium]MDR2715072.1 YegP family protein [Coriobacteriales bacterium]